MHGDEKGRPLGLPLGLSVEDVLCDNLLCCLLQFSVTDVAIPFQGCTWITVTGQFADGIGVLLLLQGVGDKAVSERV